MQFKKLAALTGSALLAGLSIAAPVLASTVTSVGKISDMVTVTDSTVSFPMFVVGANAKTEDVAGAINVAVNLASNAKTQTDVVTTGSAVETVTGGVKIRTPGTEFTPYAQVGNVKAIITSSDTTMLAKGTYTTTSGGSYEYKQYLYLGGESGDTGYSASALSLVYATPSTENNPRVALKLLGNTVGYKYKMTFSTPVSLTSATTTATLQQIIQGTTLSILGKDFVITDCTWGSATAPITDMTLVGGKNVIQVKSGEDKTVTNNAKDYIVHLDGVAAETIGGTNYYTAVGNINGESFSLRSGQTMTLSDGTNVASVKVIQGKTGEADYAKIAVGADKIKIAASGTVTKSTTTEPTLTAAITQATSWSGFTLIYTPTSDTWLKEGEKLSDKFASTFDLVLSSIAPALTDAANRQNIDFNPSGYNMMLKYTNAAGQEASAYTLYGNATSTFAWASNVDLGSPTNTENNMRDIVFDEAHNVSAIDSDYLVITKSGFSHVLQFTTFTPSTNELIFTDAAGNSLTSSNTSAIAGTLIVDGNSFAYRIMNEAKKTIQMDLNGDTKIAGVAPGAALTQVGAEYSYLVPKMITSGQGGLYFYKGNTTTANTTASGWVYPAVGLGGIRLSKASTNVTTVATYSAGTWSNATATIAAPTLGAPKNTSYSLTTLTNAPYIDFIVNCRVEGALVETVNCNVALGSTAAAVNVITAADMRTDQRGFVLVEEALQGSTTHNWIFMPVTYDDTYKIGISSTTYTDDTNPGTNGWDKALLGTATQYQGMTTYGSLLTHYSASLGGKGSISYPDSFTYGNVYVLTPEGTISTGGSTGGTVKSDKVLAITSDVVMLDSEVTSKTTTDFVLVGGPCVNSLVAELATAGKFTYGCDAWPAKDFGIIQVVSGAFADGKTALVIAGTRAQDTDLAARVVQDGTKLAGKTAASVEVTGESFASVVVA